MKKKILLFSILALFCVLTVTDVFADNKYYFDTRIGFRAGPTGFRESIFEMKIDNKISVGIVNSLEDGFLLEGSLKDWRLGLFAEYSLSTPSDSLTISPFLGASYNRSMDVLSSISIDGGVKGKMKNFPLFPVAYYIEGICFSDSMMLDHFLGAIINLGFLYSYLNLDLGYNGMLYYSFTDGKTSYKAGLAARISAEF